MLPTETRVLMVVMLTIAALCLAIIAGAAARRFPSFAASVATAGIILTAFALAGNLA